MNVKAHIEIPGPVTLHVQTPPGRDEPAAIVLDQPDSISGRLYLDGIHVGEAMIPKRDAIDLMHYCSPDPTSA